MAQECPDLRGTHLRGVPQAMVPDVPLHPTGVRLLGAEAVVLEPYRGSNAVEESGLRHGLRGCGYSGNFTPHPLTLPSQKILSKPLICTYSHISTGAVEAAEAANGSVSAGMSMG
jgi:hypothetical protein